MKKNYYASMCFLGILITLNSCQKDKSEPITPNALSVKGQALDIASIKSERLKATEMEDDLGKNLASMLKGNSSLKLSIEANCLKQERGDYEIRLDELLTKAKSERSIKENAILKLDTLVKKMKTLKANRHPIIFIPSVETFDPEKIQRVTKAKSRGEFKGVKAKDNQEIIFVFKDDEGRDNKLFPGYTYDESGKKTYYGMISEEFAWNNNVWVIGYEEFRSEGNQKRHIPVQPRENKTSEVQALASGYRNPSRLEYGGRINIADIGALESWVSGKLEMKYFVSNSTGMTIKERAFGQIERSAADNRWYDFRDVIGNWDNAIWGPYTYERWIEEDGGSPVTISSPITPVPGGPTYNISTTMTDDDTDCGLAGVFYDDTYYALFPLQPQNWKFYTISHMSFQRTSEYQ